MAIATYYLTPADLSPAVLEAASKVAQWDAHEETWEVFCPLPETVTVSLDGEEFFDFCCDWHNFAEQNNIGYHNVGTTLPSLEVVIHLR